MQTKTVIIYNPKTLESVTIPAGVHKTILHWIRGTLTHSPEDTKELFGDRYKESENVVYITSEQFREYIQNPENAPDYMQDILANDPYEDTRDSYTLSLIDGGMDFVAQLLARI